MSRLRGLDVSHNNGPINWGKVKAAGSAFAFIKASEGSSFTDPAFHANWRGAKAAGMIPGAYHFFQPGIDPTLQFEHFLHAVGGIAGLKGGLVPALDVEVASDLSASAYTQRVLIWVKACVKVTGKNPILYTYPSFATHNLTHGPLADCPLWAASYPSRLDVEAGEPVPFSGWSGWSFWQYTDKGDLDGVPGSRYADLDVMNADAFHPHLLI